MAGVAMRIRSELRTHRRAIVALALLVGIAGGVVLAATAGARRTSSSFTRLIAHNHVADVLVNPDAGTDSALKPIAVARLPQVVDATDVNGVSMTTLTKQGYPDLPNSAVVLASSDPSTLINVPRVFEGRRADPRRATEAMIDVTYAAKTGLKAGSELTLYWPRDIQHAAISPAQGPPPSLKAYPFRVAGVVVDPFTVSSDEGFQSGYIFLTAAFWKQHPETSAGYWGEAVRLRRGAADIPAFRQAVEQLVPDESIAFQTLPVTRDKTQRAIRPYADALAFFAFAVAVAGLLLVGQSLSRQLFVDSSDHPVLYAIGFTRSQLFALGMLRAAMVGITGAAIACGIGAAASALFPIGPGRLAEPTPGPMIDGSVLLLGAAAVIVVVLLLAVAPAWRGALAVDAAGESSPSVSRVAGALARSGAPAPAIVGIRLAMEPGRGRTAVPVRTTIGAAAIGIASVLAALTFGTGLTHLANTPRLYGWNWNVLVETPGEGPGPAQAGLRSIEAVLANDRLVGGWTRASISEVILNGRSVVSVGIETVKGRVHPTLAAGRIPRSDDEVALGSVTMRHLGVSLGDTVAATYGPVSRTMKIVGRVVLPGLGNYPGADKTALGEGAVLTRRTALELGPGFGVSLFVQFRPGATVAYAARELQPKFDALPVPVGGDTPTLSRVRRPSDVQNYERVRATPIALAAVLGLLALAAVAHVLGAAVRRRARDLAVLKTLGMIRRQVRSTVAWQASAVALVALSIGVPTGVAAGRWAWSAFATQLGTVAEPRVPAAVVAASIPLVLVACNVVAAFPGRRAAKTAPALVLRSE